MKHLLLTALFICIACIGARAQQAKAYEVVSYRAKYKNLSFKLSYADGYLGTSAVTKIEPRHKLITFTPVDGVPDNNGSFKFRANSVSGKSEVELLNVDDEAEAPAIIKGVYLKNTQQIPLLFKRSK